MRSPVVSRLGFWFAILTASLTAISFGISIFATPYNSFPYPYVAPFILIDHAWLYPAFLLAPVFVVLMACIHYYASDEKTVFSQVGLSFAMMYAVFLMADYFIQWTVVLPSTLSGEIAAELSLFTMYNPHGIFVSLEVLGYLMMNASLLSVAPPFGEGSKVERSMRWLFVVAFALAVGSVVGLSLTGYDVVVSEVIIITISWIALMVSGVLLSIIFRRVSVRIEQQSLGSGMEKSILR